MKRILAAIFAVLAIPTSAEAAITINIDQIGTSVVATGSGSFNTAGLTTFSSGNQGGSFINAAAGVVSVGTAAPIKILTGLSGPILGFLQGPIFASSSSGDTFGVGQNLGAIYLPVSYQSNAALSGTSTYLNTSLSALGLRAGQYIFRSSGDTVTLNIGATSAVPEPATWAMMLLGMGAVGFAMRRRHKTVPTTVARMA